ncbi:MAG TPA: flagellar protein FlaG [Desulfobulbaceae bacterium]|nr:flagellar protein FlaG [Desulfobulbaceae bacterium]
MNIDAINTNTVVPPRIDEPVQQVERSHKEAQKEPQTDAAAQKKIQPEELLSQIKSLTDDGRYSVRFEKNDDIHEMVVKIVDQKTDEVIRQIPPKELINLTKHLQELQGSIVDTVS